MGAVLYLLSTIKQQLLEASGEQRSWSSRSGGLELTLALQLSQSFSCRVCRQTADMCSNQEPHDWDGTTL
ncbi:unnamed protein product [Arctogadus glacialis]